LREQIEHDERDVLATQTHADTAEPREVGCCVGFGDEFSIEDDPPACDGQGLQVSDPS